MARTRVGIRAIPASMAGLIVMVVSLSTVPASIAAAQPASCRAIPVEADGPLRSAAARAAFDVDGTGVTVGVVSDSFSVAAAPSSTAAEDVAAGVLPGPGNPCGYSQPVDVLTEGAAGSTDEGRAMLQNVHGIAPGARLLFAAAGPGQFTMADSIRALAAAGADVIVDDDSPFTEPLFQDGPIAAAVTEVTAQGITYLAAAGNSTQTGAAGTAIAGRQYGSWATPAFRSAPCPAAVKAPVGTDCLDFDPGPGVDPTQTYTIDQSKTLVLILGTSQPMPVSSTVVAPVLLDGSGHPSEDFFVEHLGDQSPNSLGVYMGTGAGPATVSLVIIRSDATFTDAVKYFFKQAPGVSDVEYLESAGADVVGPVTFGHSTSPDVISVAAAPWTAPTVPEPFSSIGPTTLRYGPWIGSTRAAPLPAPELRTGPDVLSVDDVQTSFFSAPSVEGMFRFSGTSSAAPHAAAVVALGLDRFASSTPAQVRAALLGSAVPTPSPYAGVDSPNVTGAGLIDAVGFVDALAPGPNPQEPAPHVGAAPMTLAATGPSTDIATAGAALLTTVGSLLLMVTAVLRVRSHLGAGMTHWPRDRRPQT